MKKLILAFLFISGVYQLKAQTLLVKPKDDFANPMEKYLKSPAEVKPDTYNLLMPKPDLNKVQVLTINNAQPFHSKMPILKLDGFDNMPIAKLDGYDNMPILGIDLNKARREALSHSY